MLSPRGGSLAREGDVVLVFHGHLNFTPLTLQRDATLHCKEGKFKHNDIIGKPLGTYVRGVSNVKAYADTTTPWILVLQNSADLWTQAVPHRTQIIYDTDIAVVTFNLRLRSGMRVVEAGTGSGSLTHSLAKVVAPHGTVFTCDFHKGRCLEARQEFRANGLSAGLVRSSWRDVCTTNTDTDAELLPLTATATGEGQREVDVAAQEAPRTGFGLPAASVDAVFLDVPAPWAAVENVVHVLRPGGMLCTFSPCIEQVQRTASKLREEPYSFVDVRTVEALSKFYDPVFKRARNEDDSGTIKFRASLVSKGHSAYLTFARRRLPPLGGSLVEQQTACAEEGGEAAAAEKGNP